MAEPKSTCYQGIWERNIYGAAFCEREGGQAIFIDCEKALRVITKSEVIELKKPTNFVESLELNV